ncbi:MAG: OB-fold domain-containing protein [Microthrixaceae bacterium]
MRGIISGAAYVPYWRLQRARIAEFHGGRAQGARSVASYDEDTTTMAVEAARLALASVAPSAPGDHPGDAIGSLTFATSTPTYAEKTNATIAHAALRLPRTCGAFDTGGALRSGIGSLLGALRGAEPASLVLSADIRTGPANSPDEANGGDAGAALIVGDDTSGPVIAEYLGGASITAEYLDRWRGPGETRVKAWEDRFGESRALDLGMEAWIAALDDTGVGAAPGLDGTKRQESVEEVLITGPRPKANTGLAKKLARAAGVDLTATVGNAGTADAALQLVAALETAEPGKVIALISLADGADVAIFRTTDAIADWNPARTVEDQIAAGNDSLPYAKFLSWRGTLVPNPPNRPEPARASGAAAGRSSDWKFGLVGSVDRGTGAVHMPPARVGFDSGTIDDMDPLPMADARGTVATFTVDRLAYSPSPPVIFAVVDFDPVGEAERGGRLPVEICDATPDQLAVGTRVEMTFRRLNTADGIANYFWKARPVR